MTLTEALKIARPGQYIRCDVYGQVIKIVDYLTNGLGIIYRVTKDGKAERYAF
jgi:hypothetical protein